MLVKTRFPGGFPGGSEVKASGRPGFDPRVRKIPWRRKWQPTPVFLPGKSHGCRSLGATVYGATRVRHDLVTKPPPFYRMTAFRFKKPD